MEAAIFGGYDGYVGEKKEKKKKHFLIGSSLNLCLDIIIIIQLP